jgi:hypothetical protein
MRAVRQLSLLKQTFKGPLAFGSSVPLAFRVFRRHPYRRIGLAPRRSRVLVGIAFQVAESCETHDLGCSSITWERRLTAISVAAIALQRELAGP